MVTGRWVRAFHPVGLFRNTQTIVRAVQPLGDVLSGFHDPQRPFRRKDFLCVPRGISLRPLRTKNLSIFDRNDRNFAPSSPPEQYPMRRPIHDRRHDDKISDQVQPPRHHVLFAKEQSPCPVHIHLRTPEMIDRHYHPADQRL